MTDHVKDADWVLLPSKKEDILERFKQVDGTEKRLAFEMVKETKRLLQAIRLPLVGHRNPIIQRWLEESWQDVSWLLEEMKSTMFGSN